MCSRNAVRDPANKPTPQTYDSDVTMALNVAQKLIQSHLLDGDMYRPGSDIALEIDQVLLQDVLGTLVMLELDAMMGKRQRFVLQAGLTSGRQLSQQRGQALNHAWVQRFALFDECHEADVGHFMDVMVPRLCISALDRQSSQWRFGERVVALADERFNNRATPVISVLIAWNRVFRLDGIVAIAPDKDAAGRTI